MEIRCNICNRNFKTEESLKQHNQMKHSFEKAKSKKINSRKVFMFTVIILIIILSSFSIYSYTKKPGEYDDFAKCLSEKEVIVYGNDYCSYTSTQLNYFGKSKKYLNYVRCVDDEELCNNKNIDVTPTWEIDGEMYEQVQNFEKLSSLTGCEIK